jgi:AcrR family transcriptional regulator
MARPKSEQKRALILAAATNVFAHEGLDAPTAKISKAAGIADGSLFTYFETKDDLFNQLYLELKSEGREEMMSAYPTNAPLKERVRHVWDRYVDLCLASPDKYKVLAQLSVSGHISEQSRSTSLQGYEAVHVMIQECLMNGALRDQPPVFGAALFFSLAEVTVLFIGQHPTMAEQHRSAGFTALWNALTSA